MVKNLLLQFDTDAWASSFDAVVAADAGVDWLLPYANMRPEQVTGLVHGAMFTRSPSKLKHTAIFVGGGDVAMAEQIYRQVLATFFGPVRVSVAMDANGCNTTSVAAVDCALAGYRQCLEQESAGTPPLSAWIFGGTGPVGQRIATLLADRGFRVTLHSRSIDKAEAVCETLRGAAPGVEISANAAASTDAVDGLLEHDLIFNAGAAGVQNLNDAAAAALARSAGVMVDLNAVPPAGIARVGVLDSGRAEGQRLLYGALAVGAQKMTLHRAMIRSLFEKNDQTFNLREIAALSAELATKVEHSA
jgi:hypothetical protein